MRVVASRGGVARGPPAVRVGASTGYLPDIAAGMTVCYPTFKFCVFWWKLYRRFR